MSWIHFLPEKCKQGKGSLGYLDAPLRMSIEKEMRLTSYKQAFSLLYLFGLDLKLGVLWVWPRFQFIPIKSKKDA